MSDLSDSGKNLVDGKTIDLNVYTGVEGDRSIDVTSLYKDHGLTTYDPLCTVICRSSIITLTENEGYVGRGIPIEQFDRPKPNFIEVAWRYLWSSPK